MTWELRLGVTLLFASPCSFVLLLVDCVGHYSNDLAVCVCVCVFYTSSVDHLQYRNYLQNSAGGS